MSLLFSGTLGRNNRVVMVVNGKSSELGPSHLAYIDLSANISILHKPFSQGSEDSVIIFRYMINLFDSGSP